MEELNVTSTLQRFLEAHSIGTSMREGKLVAGETTMSATIFRKPSSSVSSLLQLDINVWSPLIKGDPLIESFAGWGDDEEEAIKQAWDKFSRCSLHVLLAVFCNQEHEEQVDWEDWQYNGVSWRVCLGPLFRQGFGEHKPSHFDCGELLDLLRDALLPKLSSQCHWLRFYYMQRDGSRVGSECLLDNESWPTGEQIVDQWKWPTGFYSVRLFIILLPSSGK